MAGWLGTCLLFSVVAFALFYRKNILSFAFLNHGTGVRQNKVLDDEKCRNPYTDIEPLPNFDWAHEMPQKLHPFKSTFHLTMGLQTTTLSHLIPLDASYPARMRLRRQLLSARSHTADVLACAPAAEPAVRELYDWVLGTYLPRRYPGAFDLVGRRGEGEELLFLRNGILGEEIPVRPQPGDVRDCLTLLGGNVDCEFCVMMPGNGEERVEPGWEEEVAVVKRYCLRAYVLLFPSGFDTKEKMGKPLAGIHAPVPGYGAKLERSMDRFFATLPFGKVVKRSNWSVQASSGELFQMEGQHMNTAPVTSGTTDGASTSAITPQLGISVKAAKSEGAGGRFAMTQPMYAPSKAEREEWRAEAERVRPEEGWLRIERQTVHRLERTGAVAFAFRTYMDPLRELVGTERGKDLADAIRGLTKGNVPAMEVYKRAVVWSEKVVEYVDGGKT